MIEGSAEANCFVEERGRRLDRDLALAISQNADIFYINLK